MKNGGKNKSVVYILFSVYVYIYIYIYIYIRGVNFNALTHVINLKNFTR